VYVDPYENNWKIIPIDGYGNAQMLRSIIRNEKIDLVWFMTDPRFWGWLWEIENEIRPLCPLVYHHVWDNYPYPHFNRDFYMSNDHIVTISKVTDDIVRTVAPEVGCTYLPHSVNSEIFRPLSEQQIQEIKSTSLAPGDQSKVVFFWNNRNARRKQSGSLIHWFKSWIDKNDLKDKACLIMHTDPKDPHGQDLVHIIDHLGIDKEVMLSTKKVHASQLSAMYNMADCTINIADAEGFGLATLESLSCGTPIIVTKTGGLQEQVRKGQKTFGIEISPSSKAIIGSQQVPYIYEDRIKEKDFHKALTKMYKLHDKKRKELGMKGRQHVLDNYNFEVMQQKWVDTIDGIVEENGSWETRKNYNGIRFMEVA
jgi:glycosyltransferase involved in cell wall biosynthesis